MTRVQAFVPPHSHEEDVSHIAELENLERPTLIDTPELDLSVLDAMPRLREIGRRSSDEEVTPRGSSTHLIQK